MSPTADSMRINTFIPLKFSQFYSASTENECLMFRFIICRTYLYIYGEKIIYPLNLANPFVGEVEVDKIEFQLQDDRLLSAAVCGNIPLFFSRSHGLMCVSPSDFDSNDFMNTTNPQQDVYSSQPHGEFSLDLPQSETSSFVSVNERNLCMYEFDPDEMYDKHNDDVSKFKAAFVYCLKGNNTMCNKILKELLLSTTEGQMSSIAENQLDK